MNIRDDKSWPDWGGIEGDQFRMGVAPDPRGDNIPDEGFSVIRLPPPLLGTSQRQLWQRVCVMAAMGRLPETPVEKLVIGTLDDVRTAGLKVTVEAFLTGVAMAIAQVSRHRLPTHPDGIARHLGIRKQTLLRVRKLAATRAKALGLQFDLID